MEKFHYMKIQFRYITKEIIDEYNIQDIASHGNVYVEIRKGMYGLKEAGIIAFNRLVTKLPLMATVLTSIPHAYGHTIHTKLCSHLQLTTLALSASNVRMLKHLFNAIQESYTISTDWPGTSYCDLSID